MSRFSSLVRLALPATFLLTGCVVTPGSVDPWAKIPLVEVEPVEDFRPAVEVVLLEGEGDASIPDDLFFIRELTRDQTLPERMRSALELAMEGSGAFRVTSGLGSFPDSTPEYQLRFRVIEMTEETPGDLAWYNWMRFYLFMIPTVARVRVGCEILDHEGTVIGDGIEYKGEHAIERDSKRSLQMSDYYGMRDAFDKGRPIALAESTQKCMAKMIFALAARTQPDDYDEAELIE